MAAKREKGRREERPSDALRRVIAARDVSPHAISSEADVPHTILSRFLARERSMSLDSFDEFCLALGLYLAEGRGGLR